MPPELRWLSSPDVDPDEFSPEDGECWGFLLQIGIAPPNEEGADSFDVIVCSPCWIGHHYGQDAAVDGRYHWLMTVYSPKKLRSFLESRLLESSAPTWNEVVERFGLFAQYSS